MAPTFTCPECNREFKSKTALTSHLNFHNLKFLEKFKNRDVNTVATIVTSNRKKQERITEYNKSPTICIECSNILPYLSRRQKFCNRSCSATYNNRLQTDETKLKRKNTWKLQVIQQTSPLNIKPIVTNVFFNTCVECGKSFYWKSQSKICSKECRNKACSRSGRISAAKRVTRSKDEIKLFNLCSKKYECKSNYVISDGWDADIVISSANVAILWNGPWHYKQMPHKAHSLKQVQNRDQIKIKLFESLGWKVLIFEDRYYTPETAFIEICTLIG